MSSEKTVRDILDQLEHLMYGYNYEVTLGMNVFEHCKNSEAFKIRLKKEFPDSKPEAVNLVAMSAADFWEEINFGFNYRGDETAGLILNENQEAKLKHLQSAYTSHLAELIGGGATIYSYPDETGIPGYPVYWDYRFVVFTRNDIGLFVYGSASD